MKEKILVLPGDGIGPSITSAFEKVITATTDAVEIVRGEIGRSAYETTGQYLPHDTLDLLDECKTVICGPTVPPENGSDPVNSLKVQLDLFARVRWFKTLAPDLGKEGVDVLLWSSNNDISSEFSEVPDLEGITIGKYIKNNAYSRMMKLAHKDIEILGLKRITCLTREDFFPLSSKRFSDTFDSMFPAEIYDISHQNVKFWLSRILKEPTVEDCIVCVDLYNQPVAGVLAGMTGYIHMGPCLVMGEEYKMYEPSQWPSYEGLEEEFANPTSAILSASMILHDIGLADQAKRITDAVVEAYRLKERTPEVGGKLTAAEFTDKVISHL